MVKGWSLFMKNNKALKFCSLALSSMIFSLSVCSPVYAGRRRNKKKIFSDTCSLKQRLKSEGQAMQTGKKGRNSSLLSEPCKTPEVFEEPVKMYSPLAVNLCEICEKLENFEDEIYKKDIFKRVRVSRNVFDVDFCTGLSFRGYNSYYDLKYFKNRIRKLYGKPWDNNRMVPINVSAYFYVMHFLGQLDSVNEEKGLISLSLWNEHDMTAKMRILKARMKSLDDLVHEDETNLIFKFHCHVESVIECLFKMRLFYETLAANKVAFLIEDLDTVIASLWYIDQTIVR